jgi:DUF1009 family protein
MGHLTESLGIIAGSRSLPFILARSARAEGVRKLVAVGFEGETDPALASLVDELVWLRVGQLVKLIDAFRRRGITRCVMAGQVSPKSLFEVRPDLRAFAMLLKLKERNARTIFAGIADELRKEGIELVEGTPWLRSIMPGPGYLVGPRISAVQRRDADFGYSIAREISRFDIGQIVVVRKGTVLAVEAFEGTDACLQRGGALAGSKGGAIAVKVAGENHDFRFDIPCIGPQTVETCADARIPLLAFESSRTLLLDRDKAEALAVQRRVTLMSLG